MRWWWFGPAVTKPELERELHAMKDAGIGGVELQPVYPMALDDPKTGFHNFPYLSAEFLDDVRFAADKARELGLRFDLTLGSGWPYGGPHIPVTEAAGKLRVVVTPIAQDESSVAVPAISAGEQLLAAFAKENGSPRSAETMLEISRVRDGRLPVPAATTARTVSWFIASRTGMMVKRSAIGAEGFVLDHFDQNAIQNHLHTVADRLLTAFGANRPYSVFSDSLEAYGADWTGDLLQEFKKRRGYDLTPYLPALVEDIGPQTSNIRHDWGKTLTELINERYLSPIREWAQQHGTRFRSQTYGIPAVSLSSNSLVDLPEGEGDNWQSFSPTRWASSASHLYGRNVTSSETWTWLHSPAFRATPLDMKADADRFFLEGVNQIVGHGWPYSPPGIAEPGWSFYAAGALNDHNPWWPVMPELTAYLQRTSYVLRQGEPSRDVVILLPTDDAWAQFTPGNDSLSETIERLLGDEVIPQILNAGFDFDFIDAEAIEKAGIPYRALVLPHVERLPLATCERIRRYAEGGGIVIATRSFPSKAPGLVEAQKNSPGVRKFSQRLFQEQAAKGLFVEDEQQLGSMLEQHLTPDVSLSPKFADLGFVHRVLPSADIYFLANSSSRSVSAIATFNTKWRNAEWWDPFTGKVSGAGTSNKVALNIEPYGSRILVFSNQPEPTLPPTAAPSSLSAGLDLETGWTVTFPDLHRSAQLDHLHSWADDAA
ncbi:MAG TPA: glycosyl hydrolase, partial [Terriglobales bacterium]